MKTAKMLQQCRDLLAEVDALESVLSHIPDSDKPQIYRAMRELRELQHIAIYETEAVATKEQVQHLSAIQAILGRIRQRIPDDAFRDNEDD